MPRAKVSPKDRQRAARACIPCQIAKRRCSASIPCTYCTKRGRVSSCVYPNDQTNLEVAEDRTGQDGSNWSISPPPHHEPREGLTPGSASPFPMAWPGRGEGGSSTLGHDTTLACDSADSPHFTQPRLLNNSRGTKGTLLIVPSLFFAQVQL